MNRTLSLRRLLIIAVLACCSLLVFYTAIRAPLYAGFIKDKPLPFGQGGQLQITEEEYNDLSGQTRSALKERVAWIRLLERGGTYLPLISCIAALIVFAWSEGKPSGNDRERQRDGGDRKRQSAWLLAAQFAAVVTALLGASVSVLALELKAANEELNAKVELFEVESNSGASREDLGTTIAAIKELRGFE